MTGKPATTTSSTGNNGFTLIELSLVAVALVILLAAAMPRLSEAAGRLRLEQAAFGMARVLRAGHELAVTQDRVMSYAWEAQTRRARLAYVEDDGRLTWLTGPAGQGEPVPAAVTVSLEVRDADDQDRLLFFPDGTSQEATLRLADARHAYTITVDAATGQPRLAAADASSE